MKLTEILQPEQIIPELTSRGKRDVMEELCRTLVKGRPELDVKNLMKVLKEREQLGSTGIGDGIAIPHGKLPNLSQLLLAFGRSKDGVDFDSLDGKPAHLFFLVVAPEDSAGIHLKALARISRLLKSHVVRSELMGAQDAESIFNVIQDQDEEF